MQDDKALQTKTFIQEDEKAAERASAAIERRISLRIARQKEQKARNTLGIV